MVKHEEPAVPERLERQLSILNEIGKTLTSSLTIKEVLKKIFFKVAEVFNPENWSLILLDEETDELYFEIAVGKAADSIKGIRLKIGEGIAGWVARTGTPLVVPDVKSDPRFTKKVDEISNFATHSVICIPLRIRDKVVGVIELVDEKQVPHPGQYDLEALSTIADYAAIALENARNFEQVRKLTITDDLTGLYNSRHMHTLLQRQINRYESSKYPFSIIFFDLDCFKDVNDRHGHLLGSRLLSELGKMLKDHLSGGQYAARYGGDEFVIILQDTDKQEAVGFCRTLRTRLNQTEFFKEEGLNIHLTASFGIATFPGDAGGKDEILHAADERMYAVKAKHKNDIAFS
ncbi:MAG: sensor domain-containing diguanylate cyclase [bacterium]|nr:sensor domain-containing diguanylate cyclase [bacterium]